MSFANDGNHNNYNDKNWRFFQFKRSIHPCCFGVLVLRTKPSEVDADLLAEIFPAWERNFRKCCEQGRGIRNCNSVAVVFITHRIWSNGWYLYHFPHLAQYSLRTWSPIGNKKRQIIQNKNTFKTKNSNRLFKECTELSHTGWTRGDWYSAHAHYTRVRKLSTWLVFRRGVRDHNCHVKRVTSHLSPVQLHFFRSVWTVPVLG